MIVHAKLISTVNGPGKRAVIWLQGCTLSCKNCWNPSTHTFDKPENETPESLLEWILAQNDIEGVTFSGGEPIQQLPDLIKTVSLVKEAKPELSFGMFTGYTSEELESGRISYRYSIGEDELQKQTIWIDSGPSASTLWEMLRDMMDFVVAGRFQESKVTTALPLRTSTNQKLLLFSDRYKESDFKPQAVEITISPSSVTVTGFPVGVKGL